MDKALKQRLVGATVLIILAVIVLPMFLSGRSDTLQTESRQIELPPKPEELSFETRRFPVAVADQAVAGGPVPQPPVDEVIKPPAVTKVVISPRENPAGVDPETGEAVSSDTAPAEIAPAEVKQVEVERSQVAPAQVGSAGARYLVQVASFSNEKRANILAAELRAGKLPVVMDMVDRTAGRLHRVRVGPYAERSEADAVVKQISSMNKDLRPRVMDSRPGDSAPVSAPSDPLVRWVVQIGSYNNSAAAEAQVAKLRLAGLTAFSEKVTAAGNATYKVRVGPEIRRADAVQLAKDIKSKHGIDGFVTTQE